MRRLVAVLAEGRGTVQTVVAVTFTEKAAGELKLRLRAALEEARRETPAGAPAHANVAAALAHLEEARVSTIHGFCNDLLHERPVEARVDPQFRVLDEAQAEALYRRAFDRWLEEQLESPSEGVRRALRRVSKREDGDPVERLRLAGWTLAGWRDFPARWRREAFAREAAIDARLEGLHALVELLGSCASPADPLYRDTWLARRISDDVRVSEPLAPRDPDRLEAALVDLAGNWQFKNPKRGSDRNYRAGASRDEILTAHARLRAELDDFARQSDADLAALLQDELQAPADRYEALKARAGCLDFLDLLLRTRDLLRDRADVRAELQRAFTHIFVDEFQDTDPLQAEILLLLAGEDPGRLAVARRRPRPGQAVRRRRPQAVDLPLSPRRRRDVPGGEGAPVLARRHARCPHLELPRGAVPPATRERGVRAAHGRGRRDPPGRLRAADAVPGGAGRDSRARWRSRSRGRTDSGA